MKRILVPSLPGRLQEMLLRPASQDTGHIVVDSEYQIVKIDDIAAKLLGYANINLEGYSLWDILCERLSPCHYQEINRAIMKRMEYMIFTSLLSIGTHVCLKITPVPGGLYISISKQIPTDFSERTWL